ncbi:MAG: hypothetical protein FWC73_09870 [Defluviitaleaceae bacterium]|nr:hypothetical protein [Defluviitaleaceae bacterium]
MKNKITNSKASNYLRILALLAVLAIVTVVVIIAYDANGYGYYGEAPVYTYDWSEGYIDYGVDEHIYDENNYMHISLPAYSIENVYEYHYYNVGYYNDGYVEGGYIGYAPGYIYEWYENDYAPEITYKYSSPVEIYVDDRGNVTVYPYIQHGIILDGDFIHIRIPVAIYARYISLKLPYGWTYSIGYETEIVEKYDDISEVVAIAESRTYTVVTINHTWNDNPSGHIGFTPFASNAPGGFTIVTLALPGDLAAWNNAFNNNPGNLVISVPQDISLTGTVTIPAGRHIIITSQSTNLNDSVGYPILHTAPAVTQTINRVTTTGRHFHVAAGATLTLSHIVLDGQRVTGQTDFRGGVSVNSGYLFMRPGSVIQNTHFTTIVSIADGGGGGGGVSVSNNSSFTLSGGTITGTTTSTAGAVAVGDNSTFTMSSGSISNNQNVNVGNGSGVRIFLDSEFNMSGGSITGNTSLNGGGGGVTLTSNGGVIPTNSSFTMTGGTISNNTATNGPGGGVFLGPATTFNMQTGTGGSTGTIINNTATSAVATQGGGGVYIQTATSTFNFYAGTIEQNRAYRGGGVMMISGIFNMHGGTIFNNRNQPGNTNPILEGGGAHVTGGTFTMTSGTIGHATNPAQGNSAVRGGGVWVGNGASFYMQDYTPSGGSTPIPDTGTIIGNTATTAQANNQAGGGVYVTGPETTFEMSAGTIEANRARGGVGVLVNDGATFEMSGGIIIRNRYNPDGDIPSAGGGVFITDPTTSFTMTGGTIGDSSAAAGITTNGNRAASGGGVFVGGGATVNMNEGGTTENPTYGIITGNLATGGGGGVHITNNGGQLIMSAGRIRNNTANSTGGGIITGWGAANITMSGGIIGDEDSAYGNQSIFGGGGVRFQGNTFAMSGGSIRGNNAGLDGGGVHMTGVITANPTTADFNMSGGYILDNNADGNGGGVVVSNDGATFTMTGGTIGGVAPSNLAPGAANPYANTALSGGGVWVGNGASFYMQDYTPSGGGEVVPGTGLIAGNQATGTTANHVGGGVYVVGTGTTMMLNAGTIGHNTALLGGGVGVRNNAVFEMNGGYIEHNRTLNVGASMDNAHSGGIRLHDGVLATINGGEIRYNVSYSSGAGIHAHSNVTLIMNGGYIHNNRNTHVGGGGGVVINTGTNFIMNGGEIFDNESLAANGGGGVNIWTNSTFTMNDGVIYGNTASTMGGGISAGTATSIFNFYGGTIGGPVGTYDSEGYPIINANSAPIGGGLHVVGTFNLRGASPKIIQGNTAEYDGGGVWVAQDGAFRMETTATHPVVGNVHITHNTAGEMGGGIYTQRHEYYNDPLTLVNAPSNPGGVPNAYSNLTLHGVTFGNNSANRRYWPPSNATAVIPTTAFVANSTSQPTSIPDIRRHPLNNYDINFRIGLVDFDFLKTDNYLYAAPPSINLLPGAQFRLYRAIDPGAPIGTSSADLVMYNAGVLDPRWEEVIFSAGILSSDYLIATSTASVADIISFMMDPRHQYQLVEIIAPANFQVPLGQWRITYSMPTDTFNAPITVGSAHIPAILRSNLPVLTSATHPVAPRDDLFYLGNFRVMDLPMTGGLGISMPVLAGTVLLGGTMILLAVLHIKRKHKNNA